MIVRIADKFSCEEITVEGKGNIVQKSDLENQLNAVSLNVDGHVELSSLYAKVFLSFFFKYFLFFCFVLYFAFSCFALFFSVVFF